MALLVLCILWKKGCLGHKISADGELKGLDLQIGLFTLRQIKAATKNFDPAYKLGEGGFGSVYKGFLADGTIIAVKQLSSKSKRGTCEFVNEIGMISALQHPNLVKLYGCCVEGNQLSLIYEYMENNFLSRALFGKETTSRLKLEWRMRWKICLGIARRLFYLHEESSLKIVQRDIKTSNVLLDKHLNAKISDFGLAKLNKDGNTHISTKIVGTIGYMAPEYAMHGYLTDKANVYSFGFVALEIVSGKSNTNYRPTEEFIYLLDWEDGNCRNIIADKAELAPTLESFLGANDGESFPIVQFLSELVKFNSHSQTIKVSSSWKALMKLVDWFYSNVLPLPVSGCFWDNLDANEKLNELVTYLELYWLAEFWVVDDLHEECSRVIISCLDSTSYLSIKILKLATS